MYSTQAILPELSRDFGISPSRAGLSISVVVLAVAVGGLAWGPVSDRIGRPRAIRMASLLARAADDRSRARPAFAALLVCRALQGLCMPGLLAVGAPTSSRRSCRGSAPVRWGTTCRRSSPAAWSGGWELRSRARSSVGAGDRSPRRASPSSPRSRCAARFRSRRLPRGGGIARHLHEPPPARRLDRPAARCSSRSSARSRTSPPARRAAVLLLAVARRASSSCSG